MRINIIHLMIGALAAFSVTSCSDDEPKSSATIVDSDIANVREGESTYNSITFCWDKMEGINQYGYTLSAADGTTVADGVTDLTSITFEGLETDATYAFELRVYGAYGDPSYRFAITGTTLPVRQLATPLPQSSQEGNRIRLEWGAIDGAAAYEYSYTIGDNLFTVTTTECHCLISGFAPGNHEVSIRALSNYGGYTDSETATTECQRTRTETGTIQGTYTSGLIRRNNSWECTMHIFDDDTYTIDSFYQGEGYNLDIYVDRDPVTGENFIGIYNFVEFPGAEYYILDTGRASVPQIDMLPGLTSGAYGSTFAGDASSGTLTINTRYSTVSGTDKFEW